MDYRVALFGAATVLFALGYLGFIGLLLGDGVDGLRDIFSIIMATGLMAGMILAFLIVRYFSQVLGT